MEVLSPREALLGLDFPVVIKPRFGSWGRDGCLCKGRRELERTLGRLAARPWFRSGGAIAQELIPPLGHDLRVIVARGEVVGRAAAAASALDLVGVDLLPTGPGSFCVLELNGAVDFRPLYAPPGRDVYADALGALADSPGGADALVSAAADAG